MRQEWRCDLLSVIHKNSVIKYETQRWISIDFIELDLFYINEITYIFKYLIMNNFKE